MGSLDRIHADRVLGEAIATRADPLHLTVLFDLSPATATKYAQLARPLLHYPVVYSLGDHR
ncbi:hypothetical protein [Streptomyces sp. CB02959]|uniref:hypothetical protein n=1 Tax=Streptomyces sp. CB02959 TaxID=2020330 RepID=UPI0015E071E2|nr:hypothetical protein [Streptomyces sp. CB02959]